MRIALATTAIIFALDQITKWVVVRSMDLISKGEIDLWPPYLTFRMAWNRGINFGLMSGESDLTRWAIIAVSIIISIWVWIWVRRSQPGTLAQISAGLLVGGALGNVIDRLTWGAVADFLNMSCCGFENPYAFNVADIAIFAGAFGLVLFADKSDAGADDGRKTPS